MTVHSLDVTAWRGSLSHKALGLITSDPPCVTMAITKQGIFFFTNPYTKNKLLSRHLCFKGPSLCPPRSDCWRFHLFWNSFYCQCAAWTGQKKRHSLHFLLWHFHTDIKLSVRLTQQSGITLPCVSAFHHSVSLWSCWHSPAHLPCHHLRVSQQLPSHTSQPRWPASEVQADSAVFLLFSLSAF